MKISPLSCGFCTKLISQAVFSLHCVINTKDWDTGKITKKHLFPLASQFPLKPLCQQTFTQTFSQDTGEECRRKEHDFKAKENEI